MARSLLAALTLLLALAPYSHATPPSSADHSGAAHVKAKEPKAPAWRQLTSQQQQILLPLAAEWDQMPDQQRNKLLKVAAAYPKMGMPEQQRIQARLTEWAKLSKSERDLARDRYKKIKKLPPEKHKEVKKKWAEYEAKKKANPAWQSYTPEPSESTEDSGN